MLKRIIAVIGIIVLLGLYITTIVVSLSGDQVDMRLLTASLAATVIIPVVIFAIDRIQKQFKKKDK
ncbi:MAG: hypothetical protein IKS09_05205 [Lachnospiraceae bacterium]|nr:hypothetical protein [Lachnospiraceae bacterium]